MERPDESLQTRFGTLVSDRGGRPHPPRFRPARNRYATRAAWQLNRRRDQRTAATLASGD